MKYNRKKERKKEREREREREKKKKKKKKKKNEVKTIQKFQRGQKVLTTVNIFLIKMRIIRERQ